MQRLKVQENGKKIVVFIRIIAVGTRLAKHGPQRARILNGEVQTCRLGDYRERTTTGGKISPARNGERSSVVSYVVQKQKYTRTQQGSEGSAACTTHGKARVK